jgi:hypothetical protein
MEEKDIKEEIIKSEYWLDGIKEEDKETAVKSFFRTQEKKIAIFLKARGYPLRGLEKRIQKVGSGQNKKLLVFCFDGENIVRRALLEYYNNSNPQIFNVCGKLMLETAQDITSLIINF